MSFRIFLAENTQIFKKDSKNHAQIYLLNEDNGEWMPRPIQNHRVERGVERFEMVSDDAKKTATFTLHPQTLGLSHLRLSNERVNLVDIRDISQAPRINLLFNPSPAVRAQFWRNFDKKLDDPKRSESEKAAIWEQYQADQDEQDEIEAACRRNIEFLKKQENAHREVPPQRTHVARTSECASNPNTGRAPEPKPREEPAFDVERFIQFAEREKKRVGHKWRVKGIAKSKMIEEEINGIQKKRQEGQSYDLKRLLEALTWNRHRRSRNKGKQTKTEIAMLREFPNIKVR